MQTFIHGRLGLVYLILDAGSAEYFTLGFSFLFIIFSLSHSLLKLRIRRIRAFLGFVQNEKRLMCNQYVSGNDGKLLDCYVIFMI